MHIKITPIEYKRLSLEAWLMAKQVEMSENTAIFLTKIAEQKGSYY